MFIETEWLTLLLCAMCIGCSRPSVTTTQPNCETVPFEIARDMVGAGGRGTAKVSVRPEDFSTVTLACVAKRLSDTHPSWGDVNVEIFDSVEAATNFSWNQIGDSDLPHAGHTQSEYEQRWRATYTIDGAKDQAYLVIPVVSRQEERYETRIDLPLKGTPHCRFEVASRCLLSVGSPEYPKAAQGVIEGTVTLEARVTAGGTIANVRVMQTTSSTEEARDVLSKAALEHLKLWRLDPAPREDTATINYRYESVNAPRSLSGDEVVRNVEFGLAEIEMKSGTDLTMRRFTAIERSR